MACNCASDFTERIAKLEEQLEQLGQRVDTNQEVLDEDLSSLTEGVRDLENLADNGYTVDD